MGFLSLLVKIGGDNTGFQRALKGAEVSASGFARNIGSKLVAAFSLATLASQVKKVVEFGGKITDLSNRLGISKKSMQLFEFAAKQSGVEIEGLAIAFKNLAESRVKALSGDMQKLDIFKAWGLDGAALKGKEMEEIFLDIAKAVRATDFGNEELPMFSEIFGKSGVQVLQAFNDKFLESVETAKGLGIALDDEVIDSLDRIGDEMDRVTAQLRGPMAQAALVVANLVLKIAEGFQLGAIYARGIGRAFSFSGQTGDDNSDQIDREIVELFQKRLNDIIDVKDSSLPARAKGIFDFGEAGARGTVKTSGFDRPQGAIALGSSSSQGLFLGRASDPLLRVNQDQVKLLVKIEADLSEIIRRSATLPSGTSRSSFDEVFQ